VDLKNFISGIISQNEKLKRSFEKKCRGDEMGDREKKGCLKRTICCFINPSQDPPLKQIRGGYKSL
jgi:hypothetical protein